jgi:N-acetyl-anhydromuramyl-L-alanine amidase AmpD
MKSHVIALALLLTGVLLAMTGCATKKGTGFQQRHPRHDGDEIMVGGRLVHTGTPVVLWYDAGGFNAYGTNEVLSANSCFSTREGFSPSHEGSSKRKDLKALQRAVDQFVIHYDAAGLSSACFKTLRNRGLSVHFLLDLDGTIYQTLDVRERAFHATTSNNRSIGIEIANIGAFEKTNLSALAQWYTNNSQGQTVIAIPKRFGPNPLRNPGASLRPARNDVIEGSVQDKILRQRDFTPEQYQALIRLTASLCRVFPKIQCDCPRDASGQPAIRKLPDAVLAQYHGVLGHDHIQINKIDPGPAFQWDYVISNARNAMKASE